jgi:hypothetical protein
VTPPPESAPAGEDPSLPWALVVALLAVPVLVVVAGVVVWTFAAQDDGTREPDTIEIVVPAGTQDRLSAGESVVLMPARIELRVGDQLVIRNDDDVSHLVGPYQVDPGDNMFVQYGAPGVYEGYCALSEGERYEIVVTT